MTHWSDPTRAPMTRFRVRVGSDEIPLPVGVTLCGRDPGARVAVFDTLVSRRHARIQCDGEHATIEDLGSRNGTRVNGVLISGPHALRDGDRIGLGTYELVVSVAQQPTYLSDVPTGVLTICGKCRSGYPSDRSACPTCGTPQRAAESRAQADDRADDTTIGRWSLGLLLELLGKSIITGHANEAEKLMREVTNVVNDQLERGGSFAEDELHALEEATRWLSRAKGTHAWTDWLGGVKAQLEDRR